MEVLLEAEEFDRDENEDDKDELRPGPAFAVALAAGVTVLDEGGAGWFFMIGSPAASTNVRLLGAGSGTAQEMSNK